MDLNFIHLSDIHFHPDASGRFTGVDADIRAQMVNDVYNEAAKFAPISGILVTGDIAFSADPRQYEIAKAWLAEVSEKAQCDPKRVWVVPGNHDVDRQVSERSVPLQDAHRTLRGIDPEVSPDQIDRRLSSYLADDDFKHVFLSPLKNYNDFAREYNCHISPECVYWEDGLQLGQNCVLRLRGLTTVLVSDRYDNKGDNRLVLGRNQAICPVIPGGIYLILAHHPPGWLVDEDHADDYLKVRAAIQLFGHKHKKRVDKTEGYIRISAGATNPEENQPGWQPCYNIISITLLEDDPLRIRVRVYTRLWHDQEKAFVAESLQGGRTFHEWIGIFPQNTPRLIQRPNISAEASHNPETVNSSPGSPQANADQTALAVPTHSSDAEIMEGQTVTPKRRMTYRFYTLSKNLQRVIAHRLGLYTDADGSLPAGQLFENYYRRAIENHTLARFWEEIEKEHGNTDFSSNPFA